MGPKFFNAIKNDDLKKLEGRLLKLITHDFYMATQDIALNKIDERLSIYDEDHNEGNLILEIVISLLCEAKKIKLSEEVKDLIQTTHYQLAYALNGVQTHKVRALTFTERLIELSDRIRHGQAASVVAANFLTQILKDYPMIISNELQEKLTELEAQNKNRYGDKLPRWYPIFGESVMKECSGTGAGG